MSKIEDYKRKKRNTSIWHTAYCIFLLGLLIYVAKDNTMLVACIVGLQLWTIVFVGYERISAKVEILEELEKKDDPSKVGS